MVSKPSKDLFTHRSAAALTNKFFPAQFRHPNEVGGIYWLLGFVVSIASLPLAIIYHESKVGDKVITEIAWNACIVLTLSTISVFALFFAIINKEYRRTFYSTERGKDLAMRRFLNNSDDATKADAIFPNNKRFWIEIEDLVEEWVRKNWERWMEEEPEWLDENLKAMVPLSMIPNVEDKKEIEYLQRERRRSSLLSVGGERRRSIVDLLENLPSERRRLSFIGGGKVAPDGVVKADEEIDKNDPIREEG